MLSAYDRGRDAFQFGSAMGENPFDEKTEADDHKEWRRGWISARGNFDKDMKTLEAALDGALKDLKAGKRPYVTIDFSELFGRTTKR